MGPYPFPDADRDTYSELTRTMDQPPEHSMGILDDSSDDCDLTKTTMVVPKVECAIPASLTTPSKDSPMELSDDPSEEDSLMNSMTMTLTPEMLRKIFRSSEDDD